MQKTLTTRIVEAILTACSNTEFMKYITENQDKEDSEELKFSIDEEVYMLYREKGEWHFGWYTDKKVCLQEILHHRTLIIRI